MDITEEETMFVPSEILLQIFHKLPIRSLIRCKLVCKEWCRLINQPSFKSNFNINIGRPPNDPVNLVLFPPLRSSIVPTSYEMAGVSDPDPDPLVGQPWALPRGMDRHGVFKVVGSYNGLVAFCQLKLDLLFFLYNPFTKEQRMVCVPDSLRCFQLRKWMVVSDLCLWGLCHDNATDNYNVVVVTPDGLLLVSFEGNSWKIETEFRADNENPAACCLGVTVQGSPHWLLSYPASSVVCFDPRRKLGFRTIQLPKGIESVEYDLDYSNDPPYKTVPAVPCGLGELDGQLAVLYCTLRCVQEVWALKEDGWSKLIVILLGYNWYSPEITFTHLLAWKKDDWVAFKVDDDGSPQDFMVYGIRTMRCRQMQLSTPAGSSAYFPNLLTYFPTLLSPTHPH